MQVRRPIVTDWDGADRGGTGNATPPAELKSTCGPTTEAMMDLNGYVTAIEAERTGTTPEPRDLEAELATVTAERDRCMRMCEDAADTIVRLTTRLHGLQHGFVRLVAHVNPSFSRALAEERARTRTQEML